MGLVARLAVVARAARRGSRGCARAARAAFQRASSGSSRRRSRPAARRSRPNPRSRAPRPRRRRGSASAAAGAEKPGRQRRDQDAGHDVAGAGGVDRVRRHARRIGARRAAQQRAVGARASPRPARRPVDEPLGRCRRVALAGQQLGLRAVHLHSVAPSQAAANHRRPARRGSCQRRMRRLGSKTTCLPCASASSRARSVSSRSRSPSSVFEPNRSASWASIASSRRPASDRRPASMPSP